MQPRRLVPYLLVAALVCVGLTAAVVGSRSLLTRDAAAEGAQRDHEPGGVASAAAVLAEWDTARARAWATGDLETLQGLYADGSRAGAVDVERLRAWVDRGLTVRGMQTQVLSLEVRHQTDVRLDVVVTDRMVGGVAVGEGQSQELPRDRPTTRRITMRRDDARWVVVEVRAQASAAARTSVTSWSRKS
ncbi:MAG: hypothetical protein LT071_14930 [Nocardioides sp.]|nr:hypothetical protein [Nocardioides sp.]